MNDEILLTIPARQSMLLVARMALSGFCAQCGADVDTLDDVRTACDAVSYTHLDVYKRQIFIPLNSACCPQSKRWGN